MDVVEILTCKKTFRTAFLWTGSCVLSELISQIFHLFHLSGSPNFWQGSHFTLLTSAPSLGVWAMRWLGVSLRKLYTLKATVHNVFMLIPLFCKSTLMFRTKFLQAGHLQTSRIWLSRGLSFQWSSVFYSLARSPKAIFSGVFDNKVPHEESRL